MTCALQSDFIVCILYISTTFPGDRWHVLWKMISLLMPSVFSQCRMPSSLSHCDQNESSCSWTVHMNHFDNCNHTHIWANENDLSRVTICVIIYILLFSFAQVLVYIYIYIHFYIYIYWSMISHVGSEARVDEYYKHRWHVFSENCARMSSVFRLLSYSITCALLEGTQKQH